MNRKSRMPLVLAVIWIAVAAVVVVVQRGAKRENEFVVKAQKRLSGETANYPSVLGVRCTGRTLYVDVRKDLSRDDLEKVARGWAAKFSRLRQEQLGDGKVTVTLMEDVKVVFEARARNGETTSVEYLRR